MEADHAGRIGAALPVIRISIAATAAVINS
jgi:hypothetical protein